MLSCHWEVSIWNSIPVSRRESLLTSLQGCQNGGCCRHTCQDPVCGSGATAVIAYGVQRGVLLC